jgi:DNA-binding HxlR family transcriptional regulator
MIEYKGTIQQVGTFWCRRHPEEIMADKIIVYDGEYPARRLLDLVGDKWTPIVLYILGQGTKRYGEMQRHLPDVSRKMLTQTLRELETGGLLTRTVYAEVPPRVEYDLTPLGRVFLEPVTQLCRWATDHPDDLDAVTANRRKALGRKRPPADK